ncbi:multisubstrate pseudouridine synthase 7 [Madurella fahalii]|uniref:Multisubstrate pseudouridine synthase 7 n=1 Tax=Madurella fahalii TaxID=1157608 RepID=A0ABQ0GSJ9_9PEZI
MSQRPGTHVPSVRAETEKSLGITQRSAAINFAWSGDIRKRYTDFLVNEILKDGTVLHLWDYEEDKPDAQVQNHSDRNVNTGHSRKQDNNTDSKPDNKPQVHPISEDDRKILTGLIGETLAQKLIDFDERVQAKVALAPEDRSVVFDAITDRGERAKVHQEIRRIFNSRIETGADTNGIITATAQQWAVNRRVAGQSHGSRRDNNRSRDQALSFSQLGGEYLHFTLYKENKDTMDAINTIARLLKIKASNFGFAGTKDRRAGTVQRISVLRQKASNLIWLNSRIPSVKVGDFEYSKTPLQLGQHGGNEFVITLKNCYPLGGNDCSVAQRMKMIQQSVECGLAYLKHHGYINYFGLQRFGTYSIGTHLLGMKILKDDLEGFIDDILHIDDHLIQEVFNNTPQTYGPGKDLQSNRDDYNRARAITTWKTSKNADKALEHLPKRFSSEAAIIRHLGKSPKDFTGAILSITRGMRMMYIHAYQSYIWNFVASRRWSKYGDKVIEGDLVLISSGRRHEAPDGEFNAYDDYDDDNVYAQARALTAEDVASGQYTIFDIVLPTPGYDVMYPRNDIGEYYVEFMGKEENGGLNPYEMRRKQREFSLSGNYRPLIGRFIGEPQYAIRAYCDDLEQMYPTDLDFANHKKAAAKEANKSSVGRWTHFAKNAAAYDEAMAAERRRRADEEPPSESVAVTNETWVQTGIDGSAKRVKLARHHQHIRDQPGNELSHGQASPTTPTLHSDKPDLVMADAKTTSPHVGGGASLAGNTQDTSPRMVTDSDLIPMISIPEGAIPTSGVRGVSDTYYASIGKMPSFTALTSVLSVEANTQATADGGAASQSQQPVHGSLYQEHKPESFDLHGLYGTHLPHLTASSMYTANGRANNVVKDTEHVNGKNASSEARLVNNIVLPEFRSASPNPISSVGSTIDEEAIDPNARKIAVILKFQLKASNYATIVLRELMGTTVE